MKHTKENISFYTLILFSALFISSCKKDPGEGGNSSINGIVHVTRYNISFTTIQGSYYNADEWVYIIYGDEVSYGDRVLTDLNGKFEFRFLRKGNYTIYVYSEDASASGKHAESKTIEITSKKQTLDGGTFEIRKH